MVTYSRIVLESTTPYHFGKRGVGLNETDVSLPADSLFSALCYAYLLAHGEAALYTLLARFPVWNQTEQTPPFRVTSLMPLARIEDKLTNTVTEIELLPKPQLHAKLDETDLSRRKQLKAIQWVSHKVFQELVTGNAITENSSLVQQQGKTRIPYTLQSGEVWVSQDEYNQLGGETTTLWQTDIRPRVTVDRTTSSSTAYSSGALHLIHTDRLQVHLYALIRWENDDDSLQQAVQQAFAVLGESGIGGERSYGYGQFRPSFTTYNYQLGAPVGEYFTTLSPYLPQPAEQAVFNESASYNIILRRGWISAPGYSNLRRPTIRMVDTGAILHQLPNREPIVGALADATPGDLQDKAITIYRYGVAWPVTVAAEALADE